LRLFRQPRRLDHWCSRHGHKEAIVGGFYVRDPFRPLGDLVADGRPIASEPFAAPYGARRAALHATDDGVRIAPREALGPVRDGGGSATLVHRGHLLNRPYSEQDQPAPASRPIVSAILVDRR